MPPKNDKVLFPLTEQEFCMFKVMRLTSNTLILITFCFAVNVAKKKKRVKQSLSEITLKPKSSMCQNYKHQQQQPSWIPSAPRGR